MYQTFDSYFTKAEEKRLLACIKRHSGAEARRDYWWMQLARHTAVRVCVLSGLTVGDALGCIQSGELVVRAEINKRSKGQRLFAGTAVIRALRELVKLHRGMARDSDWEGVALNDRPLILSRNHRAMSVRSYQQRMRSWCLAAGVPVGSPHWWRHTWAKRQIHASADVARTLMRVQFWLGHDDPKTTARYTLPDREEMAEFARYAH